MGITRSPVVIGSPIDFVVANPTKRQIVMLDILCSVTTTYARIGSIPLLTMLIEGNRKGSVCQDGMISRR